MIYSITGQVTHSFNWYVCLCSKPTEVTPWSGEVSLTPTSWELNVAPLPQTTWLGLGSPTFEGEMVSFKALDAGGSFATFGGGQVTYTYTQHHGDGWEAHGMLTPVPEPSVIALVVLGYGLILWMRGRKYG